MRAETIKWQIWAVWMIVVSRSRKLKVLCAQGLAYGL